jgi:hypothetical protein
MMTFIEKLTKLLRQIRGLFPSQVPQGITEFEQWAASIAATWHLPTADLNSIKSTLAVIVMHMGPKDDSKSKYHFVRTFRAGAAKQIASAVFTDIKNTQATTAQKALEAKPAEATAVIPTAVATSGSKAF